MRAAFLLLAVPLLSQSSRSGSRPGDEPRFVAPPGDDTAESRALLARAEQRLAEAGVSAVLCDPAFASLHPRPAFRARIRAAATTATVVMAPASDPGERLCIAGRVLDAKGQPLAGAVLYAYHTDARGWYATLAPHVSGTAGDQKHAQLFCYLATDQDGGFEIRTIRPGGYPRSDLPQHVHVEVFTGADCVAVTEVRFADDPRLTPALREQSRREGQVVVPVTPAAGGGSQCQLEIRASGRR